MGAANSPYGRSVPKNAVRSLALKIAGFAEIQRGVMSFWRERVGPSGRPGPRRGNKADTQIFPRPRGTRGRQGGTARHYSPLTRTGTVLSIVVPSPSCPNSLEPQQ